MYYWNKIKRILLGNYDQLTFKEKYMITIPIIAFLGTAPAIYLNTEFNSDVLSIISAGITLMVVVAYFINRIYKRYRLGNWIVLFSGIFLSSSSWILFEGSKGSAVPIIVITFIYCFLVFEKTEKYLAAFITFLQISVLVYVEFMHPDIIKTYTTENNRLFDVIFTYVLSTFVIVYFIINLLRLYEKEKKKAERASYMKTIFLSNMSHEIRTPLNGILGFSSILKEGFVTKELEQKYLDIISDSGTQLLNLVNDIIDLSKIESDRLDFKKEMIDIIPLMRSTIDFHNNSNMYKTEAVELKLKVPSGVQSVEVYADTIRVLQILNNLINNALKNTKKGHVKLGIQEPKQGQSEFVTVYIEDTGSGIAEDMKKNIFYRLVQVQGQDYIEHGAGLGLSIVSALLKGMDGKIWLDSELGKGSIFYFSLPVKQFVRGN